MSAAVIPFATRTAAKRFSTELRRALAAFGYAVPGWTVDTWQDDAGNDVAGFCTTSRDRREFHFTTGWEGRKLALWDASDLLGSPVGVFEDGAELVATVRRLAAA